jgi:DNA-binding MarR family transcriptional regulator
MRRQRYPEYCYSVVDHEPEETLAEAFRAVGGHLRHLTKEALLPWGITPGQARALGTLRHHGPMRLSDLAEHLRIAPRSATEVVDDLESLSLVRRQPDPGDRRATLVELTEQGNATSAAVRQARAVEADRYFDTLSRTDREHLARILRRLRSADPGS